MIVEGKDYYLDHVGVPTDDELTDFLFEYLQCMKKVRMSLHWFVENSGQYCLVAKETDETIGDFKRRMPKIYPV